MTRMPVAQPRPARAKTMGTWTVPVVMAAGWGLVNVVWLQRNRAGRLFELDETGYVAAAFRVGEAGAGDMWAALQGVGEHGPMQAILAAPPQWLLGADEGVLLWQSTVLAALTGLLAFAMGRRLSGRGAGLVACGAVLLCPGIIDYGRSALTVTPATFFSTMAFAAALAAAGLRRPGWAAVMGAALGAASLSRSMAVVMVGPVAVTALAYARVDRTPWPTVARNSIVAAASAAAVAGWWWITRGADVVDYLRRGSADAEAEAISNPALLVPVHLFEVAYYMGIVLPLVMGVAFVALRRRHRKVGAPALDPSSRDQLAVWPLWAAAGAAVVVSLVSSVVPRGGLMPIVPLVIVASVSGARRRLLEPAWRRWSGLVLVTALVLALLVSLRGLDANHVWCTEPLLPDARTNCQVGTPTGERAWRSAIDELESAAYSLWAGQVAQHPTDAAPSVAIASRSWLVNSNSLALDAEVDHRWAIDWAFFDPGQSDDQQIEALRRDASIVIVVPDAEGANDGPVRLDRAMPDPARVQTELLAGDFTTCAEVELPNGQRASVLGRPSLPGCA